VIIYSWAKFLEIEWFPLTGKFISLLIKFDHPQRRDLVANLMLVF